MAAPNKTGKALLLPPAPNHQPARQFDQTVGNRAGRLRAQTIRKSDIVQEFVSRFSGHLGRGRQSLTAKSKPRCDFIGASTIKIPHHTAMEDLPLQGALAMQYGRD